MGEGISNEIGREGYFNLSWRCLRNAARKNFKRRIKKANSLLSFYAGFEKLPISERSQKPVKHH